MNRYYKDLLDLSSDPPTWWDENAVPRFCGFSPNLVDIYAKEACLVLIRCQNCREPFRVAFSWSNNFINQDQKLSSLILNKSLAYGDPPNNQCCPSGPTMTSDSIKVLEYWSRGYLGWVRLPELETTLADYDEEYGDQVGTKKATIE